MEERHHILAAVRNPLSIIALFVLFIEVIATFAMSNALLTEEQRTWFVVLCTVFPVLVLVVFFLLVWCRPLNFYGPQDYSDDGIFLKLMKQEKTMDKVEEYYQTEQENGTENGTESRMSIVSQIEKAERKALDELQLEFHSPVLHDTRSPGRGYCFDGIIKKGNRLLYIEVKLISKGIISASLLESIRRFIFAAGDGDKLLAIVTRDSLSAERKMEIAKTLEKISPEIQLRFYAL